MGLDKNPTIAQYWHAKRPSQSTPWFRKMFSRKRFQLILKFLHRTDNTKAPGGNQPGHNPAEKNSATDQLPEHAVKIPVHAGKTTLGRRDFNRSIMTQYIHTKASKFGIKMWLLVEEATGYVVHCIPYRGRLFDRAPAGRLFGLHIGGSLPSAADMLHKNYHVCCDSIFTSIQLGEELLRDNTYITGTLRKNRQMPQRVKYCRLGPNQTIFMRRRRSLVLDFRDGEKKPMRLLTTYEVHSKSSRTGWISQKVDVLSS